MLLWVGQILCLFCCVLQCASFDCETTLLPIPCRCVDVYLLLSLFLGPELHWIPLPALFMHRLHARVNN